MIRAGPQSSPPSIQPRHDQSMVKSLKSRILDCGGLFYIFIVIYLLCLYYAITSLTNEITVKMNINETREISYSRFLIRGLTIKDTSGSSKVSVYQLQSEASVLPTLSTVEKSVYKNFSPLGETYYSLYLNKGSSIFVSFSSKEGINYYLVKGDTDFKYYWDYDERYTKAKGYSSDNETVTNTYSITSADTYYIIFYNVDEVNDSNVSITVKLNETEFDLENDAPICRPGFSTCSISYGSKYIYLAAQNTTVSRKKQSVYGTDSNAMYDSENSTSTYEDDFVQSYDITVRTKVRWAVLISLFLAPLIVVPWLFFVLACAQVATASPSTLPTTTPHFKDTYDNQSWESSQPFLSKQPEDGYDAGRDKPVAAYAYSSYQNQLPRHS